MSYMYKKLLSFAKDIINQGRMTFKDLCGQSNECE